MHRKGQRETSPCCDSGMGWGGRTASAIRFCSQGDTGASENTSLEQQRLVARRSCENPESPFVASHFNAGRCMEFHQKKLESLQCLEPVVPSCDWARPSAMSMSHHPAAVADALKQFKQPSRSTSHAPSRPPELLRSKGHGRQAGSPYKHQTSQSAAEHAHSLVQWGHR